jgi:hypothetical protein
MRVLVCATASIALIIVAALGMDWYRLTFESAAGAARLAVDLRHVHACQLGQVCVSAPLTPLPGMFPTLAAVTLWSSLAVAALVGFQAGARLLTGGAGESVTRLAYMVALMALSIAVATAYIFGLENEGPMIGAAAQVGARLHRTYAPLVLIGGLIAGVAALYLAVSPESSDAAAAYKPVTLAAVRAGSDGRVRTPSVRIPFPERTGLIPLLPQDPPSEAPDVPLSTRPATAPPEPPARTGSGTGLHLVSERPTTDLRRRAPTGAPRPPDVALGTNPNRPTPEAMGNTDDLPTLQPARVRTTTGVVPARAATAPPERASTSMAAVRPSTGVHAVRPLHEADEPERERTATGLRAAAVEARRAEVVRGRPPTAPIGGPIEIVRGKQVNLPSEPRIKPVTAAEALRGRPTTGPLEALRGRPATGPIDVPRGKPATGPIEALRGRPATGPIEVPRGKPTTGPIGARSQRTTGTLEAVRGQAVAPELARGKPATAPPELARGKPATAPPELARGKPATAPPAQRTVTPVGHRTTGAVEPVRDRPATGRHVVAARDRGTTGLHAAAEPARTKSGPIIPAPPHLRNRLAYVALTAELTGGGIDARREDGLARLVLWRDVVGVVARRMPDAYDATPFIDVVSTAGSTLRIVPWTRLTGEPLAITGDDDRPRGVVERVIEKCPGARVDPATRHFLETGEAAQLPDLETLRAHDERLA